MLNETDTDIDTEYLSSSNNTSPNKKINIYTILPQFIYSYDTCDISIEYRLKCTINKKFVLSRTTIDLEKLKFLTRHYYNAFFHKNKPIKFNVKISNLNFICNIEFFKYYNYQFAYCQILSDYCGESIPLIDIRIQNVHKDKNKFITILYNLFFHVNYVVYNGKYNKFLNKIYF